ncbi:MAG: sensor histidine kinase, partial [Bacteroidota bacterium]
MTPTLIVVSSIIYLSVLFGIAAWMEIKGGKNLIQNPYVYALSLAVYCTAWTFYGSVGRAATAGVNFLPIYLGPTLCAPLWMMILRKMILISQHQRTTSIVDFISSRYGKSAGLGILGSIVAIFAIIPYISIQLKAISFSFNTLLAQTAPYNTPDKIPFYLDSALYITVALSIFIILFGTLKLDPNEKHPGLVGAIAFESILKLVAFLAVGIFVTFGIFNGFGDIFEQARESPEILKLFTFEGISIEGYQWFWLIFLSMFAILLLPRQFHLAVVENTNVQFLRKASWLFPLYLLLINIFVLPIALGGLLSFEAGQVAPDSFVLNLPLKYGKTYLALFVALGGFAAATSMVIVSVTALSIMVSNNLVLPLLLHPNRFGKSFQGDLTKPLIAIRRIAILMILLIAYGYFRSIAQNYSLVSIGLISFVGIAQFAPSVLGGIYWKGANKKGAYAGLLVGFLVWAYTLPIPTLLESETLDAGLIQNGLFGWAWLKPYALFGMQESNQIVHSAFWSLLFNTTTFFLTSLNTRPSTLELNQADIFVDIYKYKSTEPGVQLRNRKAKILDIRLLLNRFIGEKRTKEIFQFYENKTQSQLKDEQFGSTAFVNLAETHLAGAIGASSAKVLIGTITKEDPISLEEMFKVLEQTQEIIEYSKALEKKSAELESTTSQLRKANIQLKALDHLKADFITTVTHELRTPITSIKALAKIIFDNKELPDEQRSQFLEIIVGESERITRLINQVLDLEKIQEPDEKPYEPVDFKAVVESAFESLGGLAQEQNVDYQLHNEINGLIVMGNADRLKQVVVNLISNALKFCDNNAGVVSVTLTADEHQVYLKVKDNGIGIAPEQQKVIFDRFTQVNHEVHGKPKGSGLGLFITHTIVKNHQGSLRVMSKENEGAI